MICDEMEILGVLGKADSATTNERSVIAIIQGAVERAIKDYCQCELEQATFTEFYPLTSHRASSADAVMGTYDTVGDRAVRVVRGTNPSNRNLVVRNTPLRSVTSIFEDTSAYAGEGDSDFAAGTELTLGTEYFPAWDSGSNDSSGFCRSGRLVRIHQDWPSQERKVKITYVGGWTTSEFRAGGKGAPVHHAVIRQMQFAFSQKGATAGAKKMERLGDRTVEYAMESAAQLTEEVIAKLKRFRNWAMLI